MATPGWKNSAIYANAPCGVCCGTGKRPLSKMYAEILGALDYEQWRTVNEVHERLHKRFTSPTVTNAMRTMFELGFLERQAEPTRLNWWIWRRVAA